MARFFSEVLRSRDLLHVELEFVNLSLDMARPADPQLAKATAGEAFVVVRFPPQHVAEAMEPSAGRPLPRAGFLSSPSRLTFRLPDSVTRIAFRIDALLELMATAAPLTGPAPDGKPASVIEFPDRLLLVPHPSLRLSHRKAPVLSPHTQHTELWHAKLDAMPGSDGSARFRAIVNPDDAGRPVATTLTRQNRSDIVARSSRDPSSPHVIAASHFVMTALGASAALKSDWPDDGSTALAQWDHESEVGRDFRVRTVERGFLFPFGHRATVTTITERRFQSHGEANVAELVQTRLLDILEPERRYEGVLDAFEFEGREMPLKRIRIVAAPRTIPGNDAPIGVEAVMADAAGNLVDCSPVVFFVPAGDAAALQRVGDLYKSHSTVSLGSRRLAVAEGGAGQGDTTLNVDTLTFGVTPASLLRRAVEPGFLPHMAKAEVRIPALQHLLGSAGGSSGAALRTTAITLHERYLRSGFANDAKQVFAKFVPLPPLSIPAELAGGLAAPKFPAMDGLSRVMGPVAAVEGFVRGEAISPAALVGDTKLLGVIPLAKIVAAAGSGDGDFPLDQVAKLFETVEDDSVFIPRPITTTVNHPSGAETRFLWKPKIESGPLPPPLESNPPNKMSLILKGRISKSIRSGSSPPALEVEGKLKNFRLQLHGILTLKFDKVEFRSGAGRKMDVKVALGGIEFGGKLAFVNKLRKLLESLGEGVTIKPEPDGVVVRYGLPIPSIPLGAFSIQNIVLSTSVSLPFVEGRPAAIRFALSERNDPFLITVSIFGGTGFFAIEARTDGKLRVEAALEFGGIITLDLVIVKGGVYLLAGIYLSMELGGDLAITGHLRLGGYVDVLGLVSVSIEFYIALTYDSGRNVLAGIGRVTVAVKLIFFSESFSFEVRKEIAGFGEAPGQPTGGPPIAASMPLAGITTGAARERSVMDRSQWAKYCAAFA